ncbi:MAG: hypothetical protein IPO39_12085 [Bacteroidetes bacterium]|nr:hypothetical protein [Bacteroidota bacterium]
MSHFVANILWRNQARCIDGILYLLLVVNEWCNRRNEVVMVVKNPMEAGLSKGATPL